MALRLRTAGTLAGAGIASSIVDGEEAGRSRPQSRGERRNGTLVDAR
jgi:hypothetical protein